MLGSSRLGWKVLVQGGKLPRIGFLLILAFTFAFFSVKEPELFPTLENFRFVFRQAAIGSIIAFGVTLVLTAREFDLAGPGIVGLGAGVSVHLTVEAGVAWPLAVVVALVTALAIGLCAGAAVAVLGLSSIVCTLGVGSVAHAAEYWITDRKQVTGAPDGFIQLGRGKWGPLEIPLMIAALMAVVFWVILDRSEFGRRLRAVGENAEASRLAGIRVRRVKFAVFGLSGVAAGMTGVLAAANAGAYNPDMGAGYFIPSYAAVFLGGTLGREGRFTVFGTVVGLIFLAMIRNGFQLMSVDAWLADVVAGSIIVVGALISRVGVRSVTAAPAH